MKQSKMTTFLMIPAYDGKVKLYSDTLFSEEKRKIHVKYVNSYKDKLQVYLLM